MSEEHNNSILFLIYLPAMISFVLFCTYVASMLKFSNGDIPGYEYIVAALAPLALIPLAIVYLLIVWVRHRKKPLHFFKSHVTSALVTIIFSGLIFLAMLSGYIVTV